MAVASFTVVLVVFAFPSLLDMMLVVVKMTRAVMGYWWDDWVINKVLNGWGSHRASRQGLYTHN